MGLTLLFMKDPGAFSTLTAFIGVVLFIPLSADPLRVVPPSRLALWPLGGAGRGLIRILSPFLSPITSLILALAVWKRATFGLIAVAAGFFAFGFLLPALPIARQGLWRRLPNFPGPLNQLIRKNLRQILSTLDFWCAAVVGAFALGFRVAGFLPPEASLALTIVVVLALSTYAQTLFGLDGTSGFIRYHLLPLPGWQILAAKDLAFLLASALMTAALDPLAGVAAALAALAAGHRVSVARHGDQVRWRFSRGASYGWSIGQVIVLIGGAAAVHGIPWLILPCATIYAWSTWDAGQRLALNFR